MAGGHLALHERDGDLAAAGRSPACAALTGEGWRSLSVIE
jgi:hypothetical protein